MQTLKPLPFYFDGSRPLVISFAGLGIETFTIGFKDNRFPPKEVTDALDGATVSFGGNEYKLSIDRRTMDLFRLASERGQPIASFKPSI